MPSSTPDYIHENPLGTHSESWLVCQKTNGRVNYIGWLDETKGYPNSWWSGISRWACEALSGRDWHWNLRKEEPSLPRRAGTIQSVEGPDRTEMKQKGKSLSLLELLLSSTFGYGSSRMITSPNLHHSWIERYHRFSFSGSQTWIDYSTGFLGSPVSRWHGQGYPSLTEMWANSHNESKINPDILWILHLWWTLTNITGYRRCSINL